MLFIILSAICLSIFAWASGWYWDSIFDWVNQVYTIPLNRMNLVLSITSALMATLSFCMMLLWIVKA